MKKWWTRLNRAMPGSLMALLVAILVIPILPAKAAIPDWTISGNSISSIPVAPHIQEPEGVESIPTQSLNGSFRTFETYGSYIYGISTSNPKIYRSSDGINFGLYSNTLLTGTQYTRLLFSQGNLITVRENSSDVYVSTDNGTSWNVTLTIPGAWFYFWSATVSSNGTLFLAPYGNPTDPIVYRSVDGGLIWTETLNLPAITHFHEVAVDPYTQHIWAVTGDSNPNKGAWRSTNGGDNWTQVIGGSVAQFTGIEFNENYVVLATDETFGANGIYLYNKANDTYENHALFPPAYNWKAIYEIKKTSNGIYVAQMVKYASGGNPPEYALLRSHNLHDWYLIQHRIGDGQSFKFYLTEYDGYLYTDNDRRMSIQDLYDAFLGNWWDSNWANRMILSYNASATTENLTNFVSTAVFTPSRIDFSDIAENGTDIRIVDKDDITVLAQDKTSWNGTAGSENFTIIWNKPLITAGSNYTDYVFMYWNNPGASDSDNRSAVWANTGAGGVWTLYNNTSTDNMTGTSVFNSVSTNNTGTSTNTTWSALGRYFGGVNSRINVPKHASIQPTANVTIEVWYTHASGGTDDALLTSSYQTGINSGIRVGRSSLWGMGAGNGTANDIEYPFTVPANTWAHTAFVRNQDAGTFRGSYNGTLTGAIGSLAGNIDYSSVNTFLLGNFPGVASWFTGTIGEMRVYNRVRSSQELLYTFRSEQEFYGLGNGGFIYYGEEDPPPTLSTLAASGISMDRDGVTSGNFSVNLTSLGGAPAALVWVDYALSGAPAFTANTTPISRNATGTFTASFPTTLTPGATYVYRASGNNSNGYGYGGNVTFTLAMPTLGATTFTDLNLLGQTSVTLNGDVTNLGSANDTYVYFQYGDSTAYGTDTSTQTQGAIGAFTQAITDFPYNITLHARSVARIGTVYVLGADASVAIPQHLSSYNGVLALLYIVPLLVFLGFLIIGGVLTVSGVRRIKVDTNDGGGMLLVGIGVMFFAVAFSFFQVVLDSISNLANL